MPAQLIDTSLAEGARRVALRYLREAHRAAKRLRGEGQDEAPTEGDSALHDFRVGVRRLRASLRGYDEELGPAIGKKLRGELRDLARATGPGRDAEVQLAWVERFLEHATEGEQAGYRWLAGRLAATRDAEYADARETVAKRFGKVAKRTQRRLERYTVEHVVGDDHSVPGFTSALADAARLQLGELTSELSAVHTMEDETLAHDARVHGKRLRYLLAPIRAEVEGVKPVIATLKSLQDLLGDLNDLHNLSATAGAALEEAAVIGARRLREAATGAGGVDQALVSDERAGLIALVVQLRREREERFAVLTERWLAPGGHLEGLARDVARLLTQIESGPDLEIERKYLLSALPRVCLDAGGVDIDQGYVPGRRIIERVRRKREGEREKLVRTLKMGEGARRVEVEESLDAELFHRLWALTEGRRVRKRRYAIEHEGLVWEIDEFKDRELFLAEVELGSVDAEVRFPPWLETLVIRDVTDEPGFLNLNLAR